MCLMKKVSIILICMMLFSFCAPTAVHAFDGGKLIDPIMSLIVSLGDGIMSLAQKLLLGVENTFTELETEDPDEAWYETAWNWVKDKWGYLVGGVLVIIGVAVAVCTYGAGSAASIGFFKVAAGFFAAAAITTTRCGSCNIPNKSRFK